MRKTISISLDKTTIKSIQKKRGVKSVSSFIENELLEFWEVKK